MTIPALLLVGLALGQMAASQTAPPSGPPQPRVSPSEKDPYRNLFQTPPLSEAPRPEDLSDRARAQMLAAAGDAARAGQPKIVCGMLVFPVDASIDPGILVDLNARRDVTVPAPSYTIRSLQPQVCAPQ
jgi:hypothetical protein